VIFTCETIVNRPLADVIRLFDDPENLKKWMPELESFEHLSGTPGQPGAKSKLVYKMGKGTCDMIETITVRDLPREFTGTYETKGVYNVVKNSFEDMGNSTRWFCENEFRFSGFMKVIAFFFKGMFRKQSRKFLDNFKAFAESEGK
jgi:Polyketide cyclase / dehydrase and lipid transport